MKRIIGSIIIVCFLLSGCGIDKRFDEAPALRQPVGIIDCSLIKKNDEKDKTVTYIYSFGEKKSETMALELTGDYLKEIGKDGFSFKETGEPGYYSIMDGDKRVATMGINPIESYGVCLVFVLDR